jgi:hypothetical protein
MEDGGEPPSSILVLELLSASFFLFVVPAHYPFSQSDVIFDAPQ